MQNVSLEIPQADVEAVKELLKSKANERREIEIKKTAQEQKLIDTAKLIAESQDKIDMQLEGGEIVFRTLVNSFSVFHAMAERPDLRDWYQGKAIRSASFHDAKNQMLITLDWMSFLGSFVNVKKEKLSQNQIEILNGRHPNFIPVKRHSID